MFNLLSKIIFYFQKPQVIIVTGKGCSCAAEAIYQILRKSFSATAFGKGRKVKKIIDDKLPFNPGKNEILIFETKIKKTKTLKFLVKNSKRPILVVTHIGEIPPGQDYNPPTTLPPSAGPFFAGEKKDTEEIVKLAKILPSQGHLVLNFDDETARGIKDLTNLDALTFGFQEGADVLATDIKLNTGTNFKLNYQGKVVPIWLDYLFGKEQIYSALSAISVGIILNLNLVEISQALKNYKSLPGKMRLIKGIKNSLILNDSQSASVFSMTEALEILGKIEISGKRIAVLGDILGIGKYTIGAHESIGERVAKNADLLFTIGSRAKFIAQGAYIKGMTKEKIFQFDEISQAGKTLQKEIKKGDLILVDGSKEMEMEKIIEEIRVF
ncbi:hypothetical protein KJA15_02340 [Patescibacteria group bacterium]|nr:hypothetical protein [Patescibacteria group bacterium]